VQEGIHDRFVAALTAAVAQLKVGDGMDAGVTQGPLINVAAADKVTDLNNVNGTIVTHSFPFFYEI